VNRWKHSASSDSGAIRSTGVPNLKTVQCAVAFRHKARPGGSSPDQTSDQNFQRVLAERVPANVAAQDEVRDAAPVVIPDQRLKP
jgi:hypothetical protein